MSSRYIRITFARWGLTGAHLHRQNMSSYLFAIITSLLTACGGGGGGDEQLTTDSFAITCTTSATELHGCWKSSCELMSGGTMYGLYIVNFMTNDNYSTYFRLYQNSSCTGSPFSQSNPVNDVYSIGNIVQTTNGPDTTEIDIDNTNFTGYSIYDVTDSDELCFPDADYNWSPAGGALAPTVFTEVYRYDTIDYMTCMTRFDF